MEVKVPKYTYEEIESHIRSMGGITLVSPSGEALMKNQYNSVKELIEDFIELNDEGTAITMYEDGSYDENCYNYRTITDIYRAIIKLFPKTTLEEAYHSLFSVSRFWSCLCQDIGRRTYGAAYSSPIFRYPECLPYDEYGINCLSFAQKFEIETSTEGSDEFLLEEEYNPVIIKNVDASKKPAIQ